MDADKTSQESKEKVDDTTTPPAPEEKTNADESKLDVDESKNTDSEEAVNYKAELETEKQRRAKAEDKIVKMKKEKQAPAPEVDFTEIKKSLAEELRAELQAEREQAQLASVETLESDILDAVASSDDERELIQFHLDNSIKRSGLTRKAIMSDVEHAKLLANKSKILQENKELSESLKARATMSPALMGGSQKTPSSQKPEYSSREKNLIDEMTRRVEAKKPKFSRI